tara:strand:- start:243 stop:1736 length:1494 start_codon:yes stop_codon:yes gene_type:complete
MQWVIGMLMLTVVAFGNPLPFDLEADNIHVNRQQHTVVASGNIQAAYRSFLIGSDTLRYIKSEETADFKGNVVLKNSHGHTLHADTVLIRLNQDTGRVSRGMVKTKKGVVIRADAIDIHPSTIDMRACTLTTCTSSHPAWLVQSNDVTLSKKDRHIIARHNTLYFQGVPIFYVPIYSQQVSTSGTSQKPNHQWVPELGYNGIDHLFLNVYMGIPVVENVASQVGVGVSEERGFRYGMSHTATLTPYQSFTLKTYHVAKTGFEGGIQYRWYRSSSEQDPFLLLFGEDPTNNRTIEPYVSVDYLYDTYVHNVLYHALPHVTLGLNHVSVEKITMATNVNGGYFEENGYQGDRYQWALAAERPLFGTETGIQVLGQLTAMSHHYLRADQSWNRLYAGLTVRMPVFGLDNRVTYTNLLFNHGASPFQFDTVNAIVDDEIGTLTTMQFGALLLILETDYQIKKQSWRRFKTTLGWSFQCWRPMISVDTIWKEFSVGVSILGG